MAPQRGHTHSQVDPLRFYRSDCHGLHAVESCRFDAGERPRNDELAEKAAKLVITRWTNWLDESSEKRVPPSLRGSLMLLMT